MNNLSSVYQNVHQRISQYLGGKMYGHTLTYFDAIR